MVAPLSTHIPGVAGDEITVTGDARVDTGLARITTVVTGLNESNIVPDEEASVSWYQRDVDPPGTIILRVEKGGANSGTLGDSPVQVSFIALGE